jgi:hypothetical protein
MVDHITTLTNFNYASQRLDSIQTLIDYGRRVGPNDQRFQLELDRKQAEVDSKRKMITLAMADIRNRN